jgi:hypothetical protein
MQTKTLSKLFNLLKDKFQREFNLNETLTILLIGILGFILLISFLYVNSMHTNRISYDCRLAEISVDYPQQVKEQCRKLLK